MKEKVILCLTVLMLITAIASANSYKEIVSDSKKFNGKVGVYAKNLKTGKSLAYNEDDIFPTASTSKLIVAMAVYKYFYPAASQEKKNLYDEYIDDMIIVSGNGSFDELLQEIDTRRSDVLTKVTRDLRLKRTQIHSEAAYKRYGYRSVTTPYEMGKVMEDIYRDRYLGKQKSDVLKDKLASTIFHDEIPRYMETRVMHKVGELDNLLCDVGIVDDGKDQILISVYTVTERPTEYASDFIATTAAKAYNALRRK